MSMIYGRVMEVALPGPLDICFIFQRLAGCAVYKYLPFLSYHRGSTLGANSFFLEYNRFFSEGSKNSNRIVSVDKLSIPFQRLGDHYQSSLCWWFVQSIRIHADFNKFITEIGISSTSSTLLLLSVWMFFYVGWCACQTNISQDTQGSLF